MTNKEKLRYLTNLIFIKSEETDIDLTQEESDNVVNFNKDLRKDLNRLEKQDKAIKIVKEKKVDLKFFIQLCHQSLDVYNRFCLKENELTKEEKDLLKEVFNGKL